MARFEPNSLALISRNKLVFLAKSDFRSERGNVVHMF